MAPPPMPTHAPIASRPYGANAYGDREKHDPACLRTRIAGQAAKLGLLEVEVGPRGAGRTAAPASGGIHDVGFPRGDRRTRFAGNDAAEIGQRADRGDLPRR